VLLAAGIAILAIPNKPSPPGPTADSEQAPNIHDIAQQEQACQRLQHLVDDTPTSNLTPHDLRALKSCAVVDKQWNDVVTRRGYYEDRKQRGHHGKESKND
jgi:hypothetical protein